MRRNTLAVVEYLDSAGCRAGVDLFPDQRMRHGVEEAVHLDMVIDPDAGEMPCGILVIVLR